MLVRKPDLLKTEEMKRLSTSFPRPRERAVPKRPFIDPLGGDRTAGIRAPKAQFVYADGTRARQVHP